MPFDGVLSCLPGSLAAVGTYYAPPVAMSLVWLTTPIFAFVPK